MMQTLQEEKPVARKLPSNHHLLSFPDVCHAPNVAERCSGLTRIKKKGGIDMGGGTFLLLIFHPQMRNVKWLKSAAWPLAVCSLRDTALRQQQRKAPAFQGFSGSGAV